MLSLCNEMLYSNTKEQTTDTFNNMNDSHRYYPDSKQIQRVKDCIILLMVKFKNKQYQ